MCVHCVQVWEDYFQRIYDMQGQERRRVFDDPRQMLEAMGLYNLTQQTCSEHMQVWEHMQVHMQVRLTFNNMHAVSAGAL